MPEQNGYIQGKISAGLSSVNRSGMMWLGIPLGIAIIAAAAIVSATFEKVKNSENTILVKGYAEKKLTSDIALWTCVVSTRKKELSAAYSELEKNISELTAYLIKNGLSSENIQRVPVQIRQLWQINEKGKKTNHIEAYLLSQELKIKSTNVRLISKLSSEVSSLIKKGIMLESHSPSYFFSGIDKIKIELLGKAAANARKRASELARNSGAGIGRPTWAKQGVFQITPPHSTEISNYGRYDTGTIEKNVKAVISVKFTIENKDKNTEKTSEEKQKNGKGISGLFSKNK